MARNGLRVERKLTDLLNTETALDYMNYLRLLSMSIFEWVDMPATVNTRFLEKQLFDKGMCLFFKDKFEGLDYLTLGCTPNGVKNVYDEYTGYTAISNMYNHKYESNECVFIRNNADAIPTALMTTLYSRRLYNAVRAMDINILQQKTPKIIRCKESQRLTLENILQQRDDNAPAIIVDSGMSDDILKSIDYSSEYICDKLMQYKTDTFNEFMSRLGMNNANTDKKERLITDEVAANNQLIQLSLETMLIPRQTAAEEINRKFGLNVSCRLRQSLQTIIEDPAPESEEVTNE